MTIYRDLKKKKKKFFWNVNTSWLENKPRSHFIIVIIISLFRHMKIYIYIYIYLLWVLIGSVLLLYYIIILAITSHVSGTFKLPKEEFKIC